MFDTQHDMLYNSFAYSEVRDDATNNMPGRCQVCSRSSG